MNWLEEEKELAKFKHELRLKEIEQERRNITLAHQQTMEQIRLSSANAKKRLEYQHMTRMEQIKSGG